MFDESKTKFEWHYDLLVFKTNFSVDADQSDKRKTQLEFSYEMPSDDVHWIMKAVADRSFLGLPKQPASGVKGLYGSSRITTGPPKEPYLSLNFVSAVPEELCDKLNNLVENEKTEDQVT